MSMRHLSCCLLLAASLLVAPVTRAAAPVPPATPPVTEAVPLMIGETFTLASSVLGETRRINVYRPTAWNLAPAQPLPVLYMPDGGTGEDFLHVAGLLQVLVGNGGMRPFLLVGIENTERRRDMTGPTTVAEDRKIAPRVGGSAAFRRFLADELMPQVRTRYATTGETAIIGESLAGLFVVETLLLAPDMFDSYIALDPSLWWNGHALLDSAAGLLAGHPATDARLFIASSNEATIAPLAARFAETVRVSAPAIEGVYRPMPEETHGSLYHPAALEAFRTLFKPGT
jgi:uncharacterized protein